MKRGIVLGMAVWVGVALAQGSQTAPSPPQASSAQPVRPIGVVTEIKTGSLTLQTDAGPVLQVPLPEGISVVRVPPGAKDLKAATPITVGEISLGDRVLIRGRVSDDQKSVAATSVVVMAKTDLEKAREAERAEWRRGIGGVVKAVNPEAKEITISVPNVPPTPGTLTHPVVITLQPNAVLLRYAPDSVKFGDARPGTLPEIAVGDQVRALGTKSEDGSRFTAEKLVSGTFRNLGVTVISVDAPHDAVMVKDLASGQPVLVRTNADSRLHRLPPYLALMIASFNSGGTPEGGTPGPPPAVGPGVGGREGAASGAAAGHSPPGGGRGNGPPDFQQMLERTPPLTLSELKPGEALIVLSTAGAKPAEVTAIAVLAGVEPILAAQPKGSKQMELGPWNMSMSEGGP
ncbi:MAG: hypothetical protein LAO07_17350 [Acidobacteriia bacterium]|nr:hypothetical protein [Terriglobia bacterium]